MDDPKEKYLQVIEKWKHSWMQEKDNGYFQRALGVDANMKHDLARRLAEAFDSNQERCKGCKGLMYMPERCADCSHQEGETT